jgi:mannose-6-phosphate isomerase-like protein (cupin superfamily)
MATSTDSVSQSETQSRTQPGKLFRPPGAGVLFRQRFIPEEANLTLLSCGEFEIAAGARAQGLSFPGQESLLFQWRGASRVVIDGTSHTLEPYDLIYLPLGSEFRLEAPFGESARLIQTSAPAQNRHPVFHSRFSDLSHREERIRRLKGKDVYLMFDVGENADKLVAGYTFFQPFSRSWPPHNHTDQEEAYIFIKGRGAMEVYESPETLSFVHSVHEGDIVTIPFLNYHPVFSQDEPLEFIWCIAGERYWVGDKNKDFMRGASGPITT